MMEMMEEAAMEPETNEDDEDRNKQKKLKQIEEKSAKLVNKICFFTMSDFVEDRVRVRCLNVVAISLIYVYVVLALIQSPSAPSPQVRSVSFASSPASSWLSGALGDDLKNFYEGLGNIVNRSQRIFVMDDTGGPMKDIEVQVRVTDFVADGPLPCSKVQLEAMAGTAEARKYESVCRYDVVGAGVTDELGLAHVSNFTVHGPGGLYSLMPSAAGVDSGQDSVMLVSTPVASIEVVDDSSQALPSVQAPLRIKVGETLALQPRILVRDVRGLPVPGRKIIAFANPDPTWPIVGPTARTPDYDRRGQKVVELSCPESELSDDDGIARFTCLGVRSSNVDHVNIVFADSALVFFPWNDRTYSPRSNYPVQVQAYSYSTYLIPRVKSVQVTTPLPTQVVEGQPFDPQPAVTVTGEDGAPVAGVTCYAMMSVEMGGRNPNWFRRQIPGSRAKELLDSVAITDSNGVAQFQGLRLSVAGNTVDSTLAKHVAGAGSEISLFSVSFNCDGIHQDTHAWDLRPIQVLSTAREVRIPRIPQSSAEFSGYMDLSRSDGRDTFRAVVQVVDENGNGIAGKVVDVAPDTGVLPANNVVVELRVDSVEETNDLGFAVVAFQIVTGPTSILESSGGSFGFQVRFFVDGVWSPTSPPFAARVVGGIQPEVCMMVEPLLIDFYSLQLGQQIQTQRYPTVVSSGNVISSTIRLKSVSSCVVFSSVSTPNTSAAALRGCNESHWDFVRNQEEGAEEGAGGERLLREAPLEEIRRGSRDKTLTTERKLQSADGAMSVEVESFYSGNLDKWGKVPFEPSLLRIGILPTVPLPTLREYNEQPSHISFSAIMDGPSGDHWIRFAVNTVQPDGTFHRCRSRLIPIRIENVIGDIEVIGDGGPGALYEHEIEAGGYVDIDVRMVLDPAFANASDLSLIPSCLHLADDYYTPCGLTYLFMNFPLPYLDALSMRHQQPGRLQSPLASDFHRISPVHKTPNTNANGFDSETGTMHFRLQMLQRGIYGNFGIQFSGFGVRSRVFTWRVKPPPGLNLEVIQEPKVKRGDETNNMVAGNIFEIQPKIRVFSDAGPVNGLIVGFELLPDEGARFEKVDNIVGSALPWLQSHPSGQTGTDLLGNSLGAAEDGVARFYGMGVPDGSGCTRFRFVAEGAATSFVPFWSPICVYPAFQFDIVSQPPQSWPLNRELQDFGSSITVELTLRTGFPVPHYLEKSGVFYARLVVTSEGGKDVLGDRAPLELSRHLLGEEVCIWYQAIEISGRCSNLQLVQTVPFLSIRFDFLTAKWARRISIPGRIQLQVTDLSGSDLGTLSSGVGLPGNWAFMSANQKYTTCLIWAGWTREAMRRTMTAEITAETAPSRYEVTLPPPVNVQVGDLFLVRVKVMTASGSPVPNMRLRVGIQAMTSLSPRRLAPEWLQSLAALGNSLAVHADDDLGLDSSTTVRVSDRSGVISFPLTITKALSGTYKLQFQPDVPDGKVVLQTGAFKAENPINVTVNASFSELEISEFGQPVTVHGPQVCIGTGSTRGVTEKQRRLTMKLRLKAVPTEKESLTTRLVREAKKELEQKARDSGNAIASRMSESVNTELRQAALDLIASQNKKARGMFAGLSEEFAEACYNTPVRLMQRGDPAFAGTLGAVPDADLVDNPASSLAEALGIDSTILDPVQSLSQFANLLMSGGLNLRAAYDTAIQGEWDLQLSDLEPLEHESHSAENVQGCFQVIKDLNFTFKEGQRYAFEFSANGVKATAEPFSVKLLGSDPVDVVFNWFVSAAAGIVGVILLSSNVIQHHSCWLIFAFLCAVGLSIALPWMTLHQDAVYGYWQWFAVGNLVLICLALAWAINAQRSKCGTTTFAAKRLSIFEDYTRRKTAQLLRIQVHDMESKRAGRCAFFKGFNSEEAFFFPSAFLLANLLSFLSFTYVVFESVQVLNGLQQMLQSVLNTAVEGSISLVSNINNAYLQATGSDLPDGATAFMYVQIQVKRDWFQKFIDAIVVGFSIGIVVAAILTTVAMVGGIFHFKQSVLLARRGKLPFRHAQAGLVAANSFIGMYISSTIVSYILIVCFLTVVAFPLTFQLTYRVLMSGVVGILLLFVLPNILAAVSMKIFKQCLYGRTFIKSRAGASILHFWITFLALPGGVAAATGRFIMGLLGLLMMLPITYGPNTPEMLNKYVMLDMSYRAYLSFVLLYATHNNPIMITAAQRFLAIKSTHEKFTEEKKHWTSSRSMLILILIRFPQLRRYRKHVLVQERKLKQMKEKPELSEDMEVVAVEDATSKAEEPWIASAMADMLQHSAEITRRIELMTRYRSALKALEPGTEAYEETTCALRELCKPTGEFSPGEFSPDDAEKKDRAGAEVKPAEEEDEDVFVEF